MAIGDPYASLPDLKNYLKIPVANTNYDAALTDALTSASSEIEKHCGRQFNLADTVSPRVYKPEHDWSHCRVDDFATLDGLVVKVDSGGDGTFAETLTQPLQYEVEPFNGIVDGQPGWPYSRIRAIGPWFVSIAYLRHGTVQVTAQWGWPAVPAPIKQCCMIIAAQNYRLADAPWGVAGMTEFGTAVRIRNIPMVKEKLAPFVKYPVLGG